MTSFILHGLIQLAKNNAETLRSHVREAEDGWRLSIYENDGWVYIGKFTRRNDIDTFLQAYLPQPD